MGIRRQSNSAAENVAKTRVVCAEHTSFDVLWPLALVTAVFAVMGFLGGTMEVLNKHFQETLNLSKTQSAGLQASFFAAYIIGPLTASGWLVRRYGYRKAIITGLVILGAGCLLFWPSGHFESFGGFCGSVFIIGSAFALLDCAGIPYLCNLGSSKGSEFRVNIALAIQATFSVSALLLASYVILAPVQEETGISTKEALAPVQWVYLGVGCFAFLVGAVFCFVPLPEIDDDVLNEQLTMTQAQSGWEDKPLRKQWTLWWAFVASFCYTGAQTSVSAFFINYVLEIKPSLGAPAAARQLAIAQGVFAVSRFAFSALMKWTRPRLVLLVSILSTIILLSLAMGITGTAGLIVITVEFATKCCVYPTIVGLALRGLGRHTKTGAAILVSSISSGLVFAPAMAAVADRFNTRIALCVPLIGLVIAFSFPVYLNLFKAKQLDVLRRSTLAVQPLPAMQNLREDSTATNLTVTTLASQEEGAYKDGEKEAEQG